MPWPHTIWYNYTVKNCVTPAEYTFWCPKDERTHTNSLLILINLIKLINHGAVGGLDVMGIWLVGGVEHRIAYSANNPSFISSWTTCLQRYLCISITRWTSQCYILQNGGQTLMNAQERDSNIDIKTPQL